MSIVTNDTRDILRRPSSGRIPSLIFFRTLATCRGGCITHAGMVIPIHPVWIPVSCDTASKVMSYSQGPCESKFATWTEIDSFILGYHCLVIFGAIRSNGTRVARRVYTAYMCTLKVEATLAVSRPISSATGLCLRSLLSGGLAVSL